MGKYHTAVNSNWYLWYDTSRARGVLLASAEPAVHIKKNKHFCFSFATQSGCAEMLMVQPYFDISDFRALRSTTGSPSYATLSKNIITISILIFNISGTYILGHNGIEQLVWKQSSSIFGLHLYLPYFLPRIVSFRIVSYCANLQQYRIPGTWYIWYDSLSVSVIVGDRPDSVRKYKDRLDLHFNIKTILLFM